MGLVQMKPGCKKPVHIFQNIEKIAKRQLLLASSAQLRVGFLKGSLGIWSHWAAGDAGIRCWQVRGLEHPPALWLVVFLAQLL